MTFLSPGFSTGEYWATTAATASAVGPVMVAGAADAAEGPMAASRTATAAIPGIEFFMTRLPDRGNKLRMHVIHGSGSQCDKCADGSALRRDAECPSKLRFGLRTDTAGQSLCGAELKDTIAVLTPAGKLKREIPLRARERTNLAFGGLTAKPCS